jgi:gas vesicle protein
MSEERGGMDAAGYIGWFFLGAVAGAATALLLAPKTGRETRELLAEHGGEVLNRAKVHAGEAREKAGDIFERGREYLEEQSNRLISAFEAGRAAMRDEMTQGRPGI